MEETEEGKGRRVPARQTAGPAILGTIEGHARAMWEWGMEGEHTPWAVEPIHSPLLQLLENFLEAHMQGEVQARETQTAWGTFSGQ